MYHSLFSEWVERTLDCALSADATTVKKYLLTKLKVERPLTGIRPASAVDFERYVIIEGTSLNWKPSWKQTWQLFKIVLYVRHVIKNYCTIYKFILYYLASLDRSYLLNLLESLNNIISTILSFIKSYYADRCSVRIVKSWRAGIGKTLYKKRMVAEMSKLVHNINRRKSSNVTIPLHERVISTDDIMDILLDETLSPRCPEPRIFHIDISHVVRPFWISLCVYSYYC